jgi:hypothetical protein
VLEDLVVAVTEENWSLHVNQACNSHEWEAVPARPPWCLLPMSNEANPTQTHCHLPPNPFTLGTAPYGAYEHCVRLEQELGCIADFIPTMAARVLGHALRLAPSDVGCDALAQEIIDCQGDPELLAGLAHLYVYGMIRVCESQYSQQYCSPI